MVWRYLENGGGCRIRRQTYCPSLPATCVGSTVHRRSENQAGAVRTFTAEDNAVRAPDGRRAGGIRDRNSRVSNVCERDVYGDSSIRPRIKRSGGTLARSADKSRRTIPLTVGIISAAGIRLHMAGGIHLTVWPSP